jgi:hypothetical protein
MKNSVIHQKLRIGNERAVLELKSLPTPLFGAPFVNPEAKANTVARFASRAAIPDESILRTGRVPCAMSAVSR